MNELKEREIDRNHLLSLEHEIKKIDGAVIGDSELCPLKHSFAPGVYVREIFIPKGTMLTGKIHRHSHPNFLMKGEVIVLTESGGREHLKAPLSMISQAGTKRAVYAIEDTVWITIHVTNETDLGKIEEYVIAPSYEEYDKQKFLETKEMIDSLENKNCLILALKKMGRDYLPLLSLEAKGHLLPFKQSIELLRLNNISLEGLFVQKNESGEYHVDCSTGTALENIGTDIGQTIVLSDSDMVGSWIASAIGGGAVVGGIASYLGGKTQANASMNAAEAQLQAAREAIAAQQQGADKAWDIYLSQANLARKDLEPLRKLGLQNLLMAQGYTDPNSKYSQQERAVFGRTLTNNLSARGLTASGTEMAGLSDFEVQLARERRNLVLGLAGQGANTLQSLSNINTGVGQIGTNIYNNLGQSASSTLFNSGNQQAQGILGAGAANAQGLIGIGNAFQTGLAGYGQYQQNQALMQQSNQQYNSLMSLLQPQQSAPINPYGQSGYNPMFGNNPISMNY
jgi:hypothetical protein